MKLINNWYDRNDVLYAMQPYLYKREFALLRPKHLSQYQSTRYRKAHNTQSITYLLDRFHMDRDPYNLYTSLAKYRDGIPSFPANRPTSDVQYWVRNSIKKIEEFDFFLDIDCPDHDNIEYAKESAINIFNFLNDNNIPFKLRFSGCGFHFVIPQRYFKPRSYDPLNSDNIYKYYLKLARYFYEEYTEMVDLTIYNSDRLIKVPYSLAIYEDAEYVCLPIDHKAQLVNFKLELMRPEYHPKLNKERLFNASGNIDKLNLQLVVN